MCPNDCGRCFDGIEIGAVSVKRVRVDGNGHISCEVRRHEGAPREHLKAMFDSAPAGLVVTGQAAALLLDLPYRSETECLEMALSHHKITPDIVLSLGGETFCVYGMKEGRVCNILSTSKCAAGTGEFVVQQLQRMGLSLEEGLAAARKGRLVKLASRCSVHCKSDATHKLNKGECNPGDIARSLISDLAVKVWELVEKAQWPSSHLVLCGGVVRNELFMERFRELAGQARVDVLPQSLCLEAFGAALFASEQGSHGEVSPPTTWFRDRGPDLPRLPPLQASEEMLDYRVRAREDDCILPGSDYVLGVDAGSTTTKAVLFNLDDGSVGARCYLRTLGNPVRAARECLRHLLDAPGIQAVNVVQAGVTGSGREVVSVFLHNCPSFNEILAHARSAREEVPGVDTVFEIGGQDSKYISFEQGVPVDYAMNEGCSAGTGSFIEESASVDMQVATEEISDRAMASSAPLAFGERCAAFINTDLRNALQQGARQEDVIAGLACSVADNFVSRVVGSRRVGEPLLFLGGVARNRAVALALAGRTQQRVVVPSHPEYMGCLGVCLMVRDRLDDGRLTAGTLCLPELPDAGMSIRGAFHCKACANSCEIQRIEIGRETYPFGGLCSRYEILRHQGQDAQEGKDFVALRNKLIFETFGPEPLDSPRGRIGLPLALTAYELFPFYVKLIEGLGYDVVLSTPSKEGTRRTAAPVCYPCELAHGAVSSLLEQEVDFIFVPRIIEMPSREGDLHNYTCPTTVLIADLLGAAFSRDAGRFLSPHMGFSDDLRLLSRKEVAAMGEQLGLARAVGEEAVERALDHYRQFRLEYETAGKRELDALKGEPAVVLAGRPYVTCSSEANLSLPRKIASRGYHVVPADMLPWLDGAQPHRDVWHFTRLMSNAVAHVKHSEDLYACLVSCFSCGPDSSMYHFFRRELAGRPFCYLEIDSHTAHAGFETRVGAFLDIVDEERRRTGGPGSPPAVDPNPLLPDRGQASGARGPGAANVGFRPARLSEALDCIIGSDGKPIAYDDPRVVHVWASNHSALALAMVRKLYDKLGRKFRTVPRTDAAIMQQARRLCSGRECIPMTATVGSVLNDIVHQRSANEVCIYYSLDQEGPCQNGAWPLVWETMNERLGLKDVVMGVWPFAANNYLGLGNAFNLFANGGLFLGDLFEEARNTILCLGRDRGSAQEAFVEAFERFLEHFPGEGTEMEDALGEWAARMREIPLRAPLRDTPRILIIGGLNLLFVHDPVEAYLLEQGVLAKVVPYSEGMCWIASENMVRYALRHGIVDPKEQFARLPRSDDRAAMVHARQSRYSVQLIDSAESHLRDVMEPSGLLFDEHVPFPTIIEKGHPHASQNAFSESTATAGRFVCALESGLYDGVVNLGSFNCQPAMNAQAVIRPLASEAGLPYAALDCEGPWISTNQQRILETVVVQARRVRQDKLIREA